MSLSSVQHCVVPTSLRTRRTRRRAVQQPPTAFFDLFKLPQAQSSPRRELKERLLAAAEGTARGARASPAEQDEVDEAAAALEAVNPTKDPFPSKAAEGLWELLYTSESAVHGIAKLPGGIKRVTQRVDLGAMRVTNTISLSAGFGISATAPLKVATPKRMVYSFDAIRLTLAGVALPPIPLGGTPGGKDGSGGGGGRKGGPGGWTDTTYVDSDLRVVRNFQEDLLVFRRMVPEDEDA